MSGYCAGNQKAVLDVPRSVRWEICHRLCQLSIEAVCERDGSLVVEVDNGVVIAQIHSVVRQVLEPRPVLVDWLEHCWTQPAICGVA
ncbi:MAG: hypothetical protein HC810_00135 [Acaryochloridaceae cyanobacterium RL_2_7]|nr:hypothetical protein [Acaryochloridaceae cyanobacterium RL_2_7]